MRAIKTVVGGKMIRLLLDLIRKLKIKKVKVLLLDGRISNTYRTYLLIRYRQYGTVHILFDKIR